MLKQLMKLKLLAMAALLAAACGLDGEMPDEVETPDTPDAPDTPEPPSEGILLTDWVDSMVENTAEPDSVNDKPALVINVEDPNAFDKYFVP